MDVIQPEIDHTAGIDVGLRDPREFQADIRFRERVDDDVRPIGAARLEIHRGRFDVAGARGIDRLPALVPFIRERIAELLAERELPGLKLDVPLQGEVSIGETLVGQLVDPPARVDGRLTIAAAHITEYPTVGMQLQAAGQVADRIRKLGPLDLAILAQVDLRVDGDESFRSARHGHPRDRGMSLDRPPSARTGPRPSAPRA